MESDNMAQGVVSRGFTEVDFLDQYGDKRTIYRHAGKLRVKQRRTTPAILLNRAAAMLIGQRIRRAREVAGLSLDELHQLAGLEAAQGFAKQRMYEIEKAGTGLTTKQRQGLRMGTLYALAMALGTEPHALMPTAQEVAEKAGVSFVENNTTRLSSNAKAKEAAA